MREPTMTGRAAARRGRGGRVRAWAWLACCLGGGVAAPSWAQAPVMDDAVKAAFICNFGKFTEWPEGAGGDRPVRFEICVTGVRDDLAHVRDGNALDSVEKLRFLSR